MPRRRRRQWERRGTAGTEPGRTIRGTKGGARTPAVGSESESRPVRFAPVTPGIGPAKPMDELEGNPSRLTPNPAADRLANVRPDQGTVTAVPAQYRGKGLGLLPPTRRARPAVSSGEQELAALALARLPSRRGGRPRRRTCEAAAGRRTHMHLVTRNPSLGSGVPAPSNTVEPSQREAAARRAALAPAGRLPGAHGEPLPAGGGAGWPPGRICD